MTVVNIQPERGVPEMATPFVSIIIPVYNSRQHILQCLQSVVRQSFTDYEVILVDDGSKDDSAQIITQFIAEHRLADYRLIQKENGGVSSARNAGIRAARGQWIAFVDSDDWIEPEYLAHMVGAIEEHNADFCLIGFRAYDDLTQRFDIWSEYPLPVGTVPHDLYALTSFDYIWARMYKKSILDQQGILFDERISYCEDNAFNFDYIRHVGCFACVSEVCYNYRRGHAGSLSKSIVYPQMRFYFFEHMQGFVEAFSMEDVVYTLNHNRSFAWVMWNVLLTKVSCDILMKQSGQARRYKKTPLARAVIGAYRPRGKKDKLFYFLLKHGFPLLVVLVKAYYGNFTKLKKCKRLFRFFSH